MRNVTYFALLSLFSAGLFAQTRMIEVHYLYGQHQVVDTWVVEGDFYDKIDSHAHGTLEVILWANDQVQERYRIANPAKVHSPLRDDGLESEHQEGDVSESIYHIRIPEAEGITRVSIVEAATDSGDTLSSRLLSRSTNPPLIDFRW